MSKSQFVTTLAEKSGLNKKQASSALDTINVMVAQQLGKRGPGEVLIPPACLSSMSLRSLPHASMKVSTHLPKSR